MLSHTRCFGTRGTHYGSPFRQGGLEFDPAKRQATRHGMEAAEVFVSNQDVYSYESERIIQQTERLLRKGSAAGTAKALVLLTDLLKVQDYLERQRLDKK